MCEEEGEIKREIRKIEGERGRERERKRITKEVMDKMRDT